MARHTLFAYVDGDQDDRASGMDVEFARLINSVQWCYAVPRLVNQQHARNSSLHTEESADRELGLNIDLPDPPNEPEGWFADIERIVQFLGDLHSRTGATFVIGIGDNERGYSDDLFWIDSGSPDLLKLRKIIGVPD